MIVPLMQEGRALYQQVLLCNTVCVMDDSGNRTGLQ